MNEQEFMSEVKKINLNLTNEILEKLRIYNDFLLEYNKHTNLTAIKTREDVYLKHFYDSLTLTKIIKLESQTLLDVGTGAGFPGLVLAIIFPNLQVTLLDSNNKKTTFLTLCIEKLNLKNVKVIHSRIEEYVKTHREYFDIVTSRAVAELRILIELNIPALKVGGCFIAMKGNIEEESWKASNAIKKLNSKVEEIKEFELPFKSGHRSLIKMQKKTTTNPIYPRNYDKIKKKPLN